MRERIEKELELVREAYLEELEDNFPWPTQNNLPQLRAQIEILEKLLKED